ncbi:hypothetical protein C8J56DRAFT_1108814 [Mycena floridula]|nr:hypothetical protein C8J56DRAFT_1108814 [Mycena floridula]
MADIRNNFLNSQRYDFQLRHQRSLSIITEASLSLEVDTYASEMTWLCHHHPKERPSAPIPDSDSDSIFESDDGSSDTRLSSTSSSNDASTAATSVTDRSPTIAGFGSVGRKVEETDDHSTTKKIIRPMPSSPLMSCFSRPSSPFQSRPSSPSLIPFAMNSLNCFSTSVFEEEVDRIQDARIEEESGKAGVRVWVTQEIAQRNEESWRGGVESMLYGNRDSDFTRRRITSISRN